MDNNKKLDNKEKRFVLEYLIDLNAERAARASGYSDTMAKTKAYCWVSNSKSNTKTHVYNAILSKIKKRNERMEINADMIIAELKRIGFGDPSKIFSWSGDTVVAKSSDELTPDELAMISGIVQKKGKYGDTIEIKLNDKISALDKLMRHVGGYEKDNEQKKPEIIIQDDTKAILTRMGICVDDNPTKPESD